jgi:ribosomal protein S18 acetylase RimI-like enzyme
MPAKLDKINVSFVFCDYSNENHCRKLAELVNEYISDPMGGGTPLTLKEQLYLVDGMANHPSGFVLFACADEEIIGMVVCFINFSTFKVKKYLYVHDVIVKKAYRRSGVGRQLLEKCISISTERNYCKITLEVREDNAGAKMLYQSLGFQDTEPKMLFWTKTL